MKRNKDNSYWMRNILKEANSDKITDPLFFKIKDSIFLSLFLSYHFSIK
jgi:hypothetical protein